MHGKPIYGQGHPCASCRIYVARTRRNRGKSVDLAGGNVNAGACNRRTKKAQKLLENGAFQTGGLVAEEGLEPPTRGLWHRPRLRCRIFGSLVSKARSPRALRSTLPGSRRYAGHFDFKAIHIRKLGAVETVRQGVGHPRHQNREGAPEAQTEQSAIRAERRGFRSHWG